MNKVVIYGAVYCTFCMKAKKFLTGKNVPLDWIDTETEEGQAQLLELQNKYNWRTIPMIFIEGRFVGGYTELMNEVKNNTINLDDLI